jgi:hypothetical protein
VQGSGTAAGSPRAPAAAASGAGRVTHRVRVRLVRREERTEEEAARAARARSARILEALPPRAELDTVVSFQRGAAVLVTYRDGAIVVQAAPPR